MKENAIILLCVSSFCLARVPGNFQNKLDIKEVLSSSLFGPYTSNVDKYRPKLASAIRKLARTSNNEEADDKYNIPSEDEKFAYTSDGRNVDTPQYICCTPDQWESSAYLSTGNVINDDNSFFLFSNGTGRIAFDGKRKKSYVSFNITRFTPLQPGPGKQATMTTIKDFEKGVMYQIDSDGTCEKQDISSEDISIVCIPEHAKRVSNGTFGPDVNVVTYEFTTYSGYGLNRCTVAQTLETCEPIVSTFAIVAASPYTLFTIDVVDVTRKISDPSVFIPPPSCDG